MRLTEWDEYTGRFEATDRVDVRARVDGYLDSIHFRDGAIVKPGDLLFVIDPRPYEAVLEGARADVVRAQTRLELATTDFTRGEALFAIRGISQEEFDRRVQARKEAEAALIVARAAERVAALNVEFTRVRAPIGGRIAQNFVSVGNVISGGQAGSTLLTTIVAVDPIQFVFDASEADYLKYNRMNASGERRTSRDTPNPVRIRLLDEPTFTHVGKMDFVDNQVDPATGTIRGRALVPNPGGFLTPGQFGRLQLLGSGEFDALLVPDSAILSDQSQRFVWTVGKDDIPEPRVVEPGNLERGLRIVRAGLQRDDRIVINGMQRVRPGAKVAPTNGRIEPHGWQIRTAAMGFSKLFIDRPILAGVISVMIMLVGAVAYFALPVSQYPEVAPPSITVTASYPGANAETAAATVAAPLEQEINGVEGMLYLSSQSTSDGRTAITVTFALGTDLDAAQVLVQNRVNIALPRLPEDVRRLGVVTNKNTPDILMVVHIYSPDDSRDQLYLSNYTLLNIRDRLARLDGVGDLRLFGAREYSMRIWLDPNRISSLGLTAGEVVQALRGQNVQVAGGVLDRPPSTQQGAFEVGVQLLGRLTDPAQFGNVLIKSADEGRLVRVRDIGRIELGAVDYSTNAYLDDKPAVAVPVFQRPGSNALETAHSVEALMASLRPQFPRGVDYDIIYNPSEFIAESVREVEKTIFEAAILVVVVIVLFLQSWRAAVIPLVAIPVSLIGTFAVLQAFGFSLNTLSLFGLVLAIGIVVDDAIVVVEDVERNLHEGMSPRDAAYRTMDEVGGALVAIALVLSAVFVPTAFIPGISGQFYRQFALTIASATLISCLVSLTLSPALAALLLRPRSNARRSLVGRPGGSGFSWAHP